MPTTIRWILLAGFFLFFLFSSCQQIELSDAVAKAGVIAYLQCRLAETEELSPLDSARKSLQDVEAGAVEILLKPFRLADFMDLAKQYNR